MVEPGTFPKKMDTTQADTTGTKEGGSQPAATQARALGAADGGKPPLIVAKDIAKHFHTATVKVDVLKSVNLAFETGETVAITGASGIGKSTLLHILGTLDRPDSGSLHFRGRDVLGYDPQQLSRFRNRSIGFVFQFHHLLPEFSAIENTMMPALISGHSRPKAMAQAESILVRVGLQDRLHQRVTQLSGGEQQRVALARALVMKPDLLLADEPTGNLDKENSEQAHELILGLNREFNMTLVVVTHSTELASFMSRRLTLANGRVVETD